MIMEFLPYGTIGRGRLERLSMTSFALAVFSHIAISRETQKDLLFSKQ
jgi:hypothetical protein